MVCSYKVYRLSEQREFRMLSISFFLIALSYILWAIFNLSLVNQINLDSGIVNLKNLGALPLIGVYLHMLFFILGSITPKDESRRGPTECDNKIDNAYEP